MRRSSKRVPAIGRWVAVAALASLALLVPATAASAAPTPVPNDGDSVYVGQEYYVSGSALTFPVWTTTPTDLADPGAPDYWAYCVEQSEDAAPSRLGTVGQASSFIGTDYFLDPAIQGKVLWVLGHTYPAITVADLGAAAGVPGLTLDEAISATTTAIWRYTNSTFDAPFYWIDPNAETVYWYLVDGANASPGMTPADFAATVSVTAPTGVQKSGSLVGPFTLSTNRATAQVSTDPVLPLTDASGNPLDPSDVTDGEEFYLDLRGATGAGSATVSASVQGSGATGKIITLPSVAGGTPTTADHGQSLILVAASTATTAAQASAQWTAASAGAPGTGTTSAGRDDAVALAMTGTSSPTPLILLASLIVAVGAGLLLTRRRRKAEKRVRGAHVRAGVPSS